MTLAIAILIPLLKQRESQNWLSTSNFPLDTSLTESLHPMQFADIHRHKVQLFYRPATDTKIKL